MIRRQRSRRETLKNLPRISNDVTGAVPFAVQLQIHESETELTHLGVGRAKRLRAFHFLEQIVRNRRARLEVTGKQVQRLALPAPVLHDLRRQLDEIPGHTGSREAAHFHAAEEVMQQVAELV